MAKQIEEAVERLAEEILQEMPGIELVDVEYVRERDWYLRVFIDKAGGVELDDCQALSERISEALDQKDLITDSYILEVSSPGLDRVLRKERDFLREQGKQVDVTLYAPLNGEKALTGTLTGCDGKLLCIEGREPIPMDKVSQVRLHIDICQAKRRQMFTDSAYRAFGNNLILVNFSEREYRKFRGI